MPAPEGASKQFRDSATGATLGRCASRDGKARQRRKTRIGLAALIGGLLLVVFPDIGHAYTIETLATDGCHERITISAWRSTMQAFPDVTASPKANDEEDALIEDVPFSLPSRLKNLAVATLLIGVRQNDTKQHAATDLGEIGTVHADPESQKEHCLRAPYNDEPTGSQDALEQCKTYIREMLSSALDAIGSDGKPDASQRERLKVALAIRGSIEVELPAFYLRMGRGLHAIQDSFTHAFRAPEDPHKITVILNFVEYVEDELDPSVDGPAHLRELDRCDDPDALRTQRRVLATEASAAALSAVLDPSLNRDAKLRAIDETLDRFLSFDTTKNCNEANDWCDAPELDYAPSACGCSFEKGSRFGAVLIFVLVLAAIRTRSRRSQRRMRVSRHLLGVSWLAVFSINAAPARAEETHGLASPVHALKGESKAGTRGREDPSGSFFARVGTGASYDRPALAGKVGVAYQLNRPLMFAFDVEYNPWISVTPGKIRPGSLNTYVSAIRRFQLKTESLNVRTTASLGTSVLLFDLVGAPAGSVGPFFGLSFLGAEWKASPGFYLTIDPTYIAIPMPQLTGVPFAYMQYRFQVGVEFGG